MKESKASVRICICTSGSHRSSYSNYGGRPTLRFNVGMLGVIAGEEVIDSRRRYNVYYFDPASNGMERIWLDSAFATVKKEELAGELFCGMPETLMQASLLPVMARCAPEHFAALDLDAVSFFQVGSVTKPAPASSNHERIRVRMQRLRDAVTHYLAQARWEFALTAS
jgi:hypothetical protein